MVELLPEIDVVKDDPFNSSPTDPGLMGPQALQQYQSDGQIQSAKAKTPLVSPFSGCTGSFIDLSKLPEKIWYMLALLRSKLVFSSSNDSLKFIQTAYA